MELKTEGIPTEQFSMQFLQGMVNRMAQGYHKYGNVSKVESTRDWLKTAELRLKKYEQTGNTEWLIDAANYLMCEFMHPKHPEAHFRATSSGESPGYVDNNGRVVSHHTTVSTYKREGD